MKTHRGLLAFAAVAALALAPSIASAQSWTTWTSGSAGLFGGTLFGSAVTFTGGNVGGQLSDGTDVTGSLGCTGCNYFNPPDPYDQGGTTVPGLGMIQFDGPTTGNTVTFATPVVDPFFALISLGQTSLPITYSFSSPFTVVSNNNCPTASYWGCGSYTTSGNSLTGSEFSGTIEFTGTFSSITFSTDPTENWHGFTVGAASSASVVPEPATMSLIATGLVGMAAVGRRRKRIA